MALATQANVEAWLGRTLSASEAARVESLLARSEALVMGWLGCIAAPEPVPAISSTVAEMVGRVLLSAGRFGVAQASTDGTALSFTSDSTSGSPWLSKTDKMALRPYRCGGGLSSIQLVGESYRVTPEV